MVVEKKVKSGNQKAAISEAGGAKFMIIKIRGTANAPQTIIDTLELLNLFRKNQGVVVLNNSVYRGMIHKVKDYVTWGEIDPATYTELVSKRGEEYQGRTHDSKKKYAYRFTEINGKKYKNYFRLNSPQKGFERKGIKVGFNAGGALGYRGEKINELIRRMW
ncbi:uL30 family ribosomal protein [Candidatus Woesearchaeota archaeon]|nr:uL30 family ribosomal protein [Candidatus Woesearchaeota archaeon]